MKTKDRPLLMTGTIVDHNGESLEIGEYRNGVYQMHATEPDGKGNSSPVCELTYEDIANDEIEHEPDKRIIVTGRKTECEVWINVWDSRSLQYSCDIHTDWIQVKDEHEAKRCAEIDVENILSDLSEYPYDGFELTEEEIEDLKSDIELYYLVYRQ